MKILFIGGTGNISAECAKLAIKRGAEVSVLNRGNKDNKALAGARVILADIHNEDAVAAKTADMYFDSVVNFINFKPEDIQRDIRLFSKKTDQYIHISSVCIYRKPFSIWPATESAPVGASGWEYADDKIGCEKVLMQEFIKNGFPAVIVRPTHTYSDSLIPVAMCGQQGEWGVLDRIRKGKPVIVQGDGLTLWTLTHSRDFAKGLVGLLGNSHAVGETVQITSDEVVTWDSIYQSIGRAMGIKPKLIHISTQMIGAFYPEYYARMIGDTSNCAIFDNSKIKRLVPEFQASVRADDGIRSAVQYHLAHTELQREDPKFDLLCDRMAAAYRDFIARAAE